MKRESNFEGNKGLAIVSGGQIAEFLDGCEENIVNVVRDTYFEHGLGLTVNPPSYFLRFPTRPSARIIALPASIEGNVRVDGIKWISSFPENISKNLPRASAILILNNQETGVAFACMEGSLISAARTAASAVLAADTLSSPESRPRRIGFIGTGVISREIAKYLLAMHWNFDEVNIYDRFSERATSIIALIEERLAGVKIRMRENHDEVLKNSDLVVLATTAASPLYHRNK